MSLVATLKIKSHRDCLLHIPGDHKWRKLLNTTTNNGVVVLELMWSNSQYTNRVLVSPSPTLLLNMKSSDEVQLDPNFAAAIGIKDREQVHVQLITHPVPHCKSVTIVPASSDDWAVCNQDKEFIMDHLQDQIRVMQVNFHFALFKGLSLLCPKLRVASMEPNATCALLVKDTLVEIIPAAPPSYGRSITSPAAAVAVTVGDYHSGNSIIFPWISSFFSKTEPQNGGDRKQYDSGYASGSGGSGEHSRNSGSGGGADSGSNDSSSELTSPISVTSTPSVSPIHWDLGTAMINPLNWLLMPQGAKMVADVKRPTVGHLPVKGNSTTVEVPSASKSVKGMHRKQTSWPIDSTLLAKYIDTPPLSVILRVQPYSCTVESSWSDVEQLDVYVHPSTFPTLCAYMYKHNDMDSSTGFLVKLQLVSFPEKPNNKKQGKSEQEDDNLTAAQSSSAKNEGIVAALVVRLCLVSSYHLSNNQESSADSVNIKPNHIVISDSVRRQMGIKDFSRVKLTDVKEHMRIPCNNHLIKLNPLNKNGLTDKELSDTFQNWVRKVGIHSPFRVPLSYHYAILSLQTKSGGSCDVEVKLVGGSKRKQNKDLISEEDDKEIDFILLEDRDITGNRVSLRVETEEVKSTPSSSSDKSSKANNSNNNKKTVLPVMSELRELLIREPLCPVGGIDCYVTEGIGWVTNALERQLAMSKVRHGSNVGALLICGRSKSGANAGYGITTVAKAICCRAINYPLLAHIIVLECADYRGRPTRFKEVLSDKIMEARWYQPSILLLDDLDHIAPSLPNGHDHGSDAMNADRTAEIVRDVVVEEMHRGSSVIVMATAQSISCLHVKLLPSRGNHLFRKTIEISSPNLVTRQEILKVILRSKGISVADMTLDWKKISSAMEGFVVRDLINIVERAIHNSEISSSHDDTLMASRSGRSPSTDTIIPPKPKELHYEHFKKALECYRPVALRNIPLHTPEDINFDNIGGLAHMKAALVETIQWPAKFPRVYSSYTLKHSSGVLLFGAPGTGKTMLAKALGKQFGLNFISIKGPELLSKYIGASEQAIRDVFIRAHSAKPCILFFDEFDALAPQRGHDNTGVTDRVVNQLLTQMDGIETLEGVYVLVASSRPDLIDPALLRPGRIDVHLYCDLPNIEERVEILEALSRSLPLNKDVDFHTVASACQHFTGADLKALLYNAQLLVAHKVINKTSEKANNGTELNGMVPKFWHSSNVSASIEKVEEITQKLTIIQRMNSGKHKTKKKQATMQKKLMITQSDILQATKELQPSLSPKDRSHFLRLYDNFINKTTPAEYMTQKATLA